MGRIPQAVIDDVLARADILEVVQRYVQLKRAGSSHKGLCPFHSEKTPSFNVHPGKGLYKCFGCQASGNVIGFLMDIEGWSFPETVRHLAEQMGIEVPEEDDEQREESRRRRDAKKAYVHVMDLARRFYVDALWGEQGRAARHYLTERGIDEEVARTFELGFAPDGWSNLLDHLARHDIPSPWVARAGLAIPRKGGDGFYDRFRHRIIFPVVDIWGNTLAFGGRVFARNDDSPKYINSAETEYYTKGEHLYGLHASKQHIQKADTAVLVEGNFDVISLFARGVTNVVAPMGTALTDRQARLLGRYAHRVVVAFDGDSAGEEATVRCFPSFEAAGIEARVVRFDEGDDPDSFVQRRGPDALVQMLDGATNIVEWAIDRSLPRGEGGDVHESLQGLEAAGEILGQVKSRVARERYAQEISRRLAIEPRLLNEYIKRPQSFGEKVREAVIAARQPMELETAEFGILVVLLDRPEWLDGFLSEEYDKLLGSSELARFLQLAAVHLRERAGELNAPILVQHVEHPGFRQTVEDALAASDSLYAPEKARQWYEDCVRRLQGDWASRTLRDIVREMEGTDFITQQDKYVVLNEQKKKVEQFIRQLAD